MADAQEDGATCATCSSWLNSLLSNEVVGDCIQQGRKEAAMGILAGSSQWAELESAQQVLQIELRQIDREIQAEQEAVARIESQVRILENARRQAA
jgi:hypothetical protein